MVSIFLSPPFYTKYVHLLTSDNPIPPEICNNPKFWPYFKNALGALNGSHIHSAPPASEQPICQNRKGFVLQNCLFGCDFSLKFIYSLTGWEGSATDTWVYEDAQQMTCIFLLASSILLMLDIRFAQNFLFLIGMCAITLQNGDVQILSEILISVKTKIAIGLTIQRSCSIFNTLLPEMSLSVFLEY